MAYDIYITSLPEQVTMGQDLFDGLLSTIYQSFSDLLQSLASQLAESASVEDPNIDPATTGYTTAAGDPMYIETRPAVFDCGQSKYPGARSIRHPARDAPQTHQ